MFLDIIHRLVHFLKSHNISETGFCVRPQEIRASSIYWIQLSRFYLRTETESSLRNVVFFFKWTRRWIMSKNIILVIIYHRHKRLNLIYICNNDIYSDSYLVLGFIYR
jgi:hypothetical protein